MAVGVGEEAVGEVEVVDDRLAAEPALFLWPALGGDVARDVSGADALDGLCAEVRDKVLVEDDPVVLDCGGLAVVDVLDVVQVAVAGFLDGHPFLGYDDADLGHLGLLLLVPESCGAGIGSEALSLIESRAALEGADSTRVAAYRANPRARAFWQAHGYQPAADDDADPLPMVKRLGVTPDGVGLGPLR